MSLSVRRKDEFLITNFVTAHMICERWGFPRKRARTVKVMNFGKFRQFRPKPFVQESQSFYVMGNGNYHK